MKRIIDGGWAFIDREISYPISPLMPLLLCGQLGVFTALSFMRNMELVDEAVVSTANVAFLAELFLAAAWLAYRIFYVPKHGTHQERLLSNKRLGLELLHPGTRVKFLSDGLPFFTDRATGRALPESFSPAGEVQGGGPTKPLIENTVLVPELVTALAELPQVFIPKGTLLYHGCDELSQDTDVERKSLGGGRKWTSQSPLLAAEYGFYQLGTGDEVGRRPLLWVSSLNRDVRGLFGSQRELHKLMPQGPDLPKVFPDLFNEHAKAALGAGNDYLFLDFYDTDSGQYREILVPNPMDLLGVHDVIELPLDKPTSRQFVREQFGLHEGEE